MSRGDIQRRADFDGGPEGDGHSLAQVIEGATTRDMRGDQLGLEVQTRAEINQQISTAKAYPRSPEKFLKSALAMVSLDKDIAASCQYSLPRKERDRQTGRMKTKLIQGPSVRLAEIIASCWGNLRIAGRIVGEDGMRVVAQGVCLDCETNLGYSMEVRRGITRSDGRRFTEDMVNVTSNAAIAIVTRNVTLKAVPRALVDVIYKHSRKVAMGDEKTLPERVAAAIKWFGKRGVEPAQMWELLEVDGPADVTLEDLATLQGLRQAIDDGATSVQEVFAPEPAQDRQGQAGDVPPQGLVARLEEANRRAREAQGQAPPTTGQDRAQETQGDAATQARADDRAMEAERSGETVAPPPDEPETTPGPPRRGPTGEPVPDKHARAKRGRKPVDPEDAPPMPDKVPDPVVPAGTTPAPARALTAAEERLKNRKAAEEAERLKSTKRQGDGGESMMSSMSSGGAY